MVVTVAVHREYAGVERASFRDYLLVLVFPSVSKPPPGMASFQAVRISVNLAPTVRVLPSGLPNPSRLNLAARAPADGHDHGHGAASRSDAPRTFTGGVKTTSMGLVSRTYACKHTPEANVYSR